ncbi:MAG: hypothetical protein P4L55_01670 [Syntrophobacteraceae bacterium]|nr:hypothetical protein [Syntrophobacteraceae bacterium]MDR3561367.1 hypothetical protein [Negativicutes bacterium]
MNRVASIGNLPAYRRKGRPTSTSRSSTLRLPRFVAIVLIAGLISTLMDSATDATPLLYYIGLGVSIALTWLVLILPSRYKIYPLLVLIANLPDVTQSATDVEKVGTLRDASFWQFKIGFVNASWVLLLVLVAIIICLPKKRLTKPDFLFVLYYSTIPIVTCLIYGYIFSTDYTGIITDVKLPLVFFMGMYIFSSYLSKYPDAVMNMGAFFLALMFGRFLVYAIYLYGGFIFARIGNFNRVSVDSGNVMLVFVLFFLVYEIMQGSLKILKSIIFSALLFLLISFQTRMFLITFLLGFSALFFTKHKSRLAAVLIGLTLLGAISVTFLSDSYSFVLNMAINRMHIQTMQSGGFSFENLDPVRASEIANSMHTMLTSGALLTGMGYGAWYSDQYLPFHGPLQGAFSSKAINQGHYDRIHNNIFHIWFKFGLIGLVIISYILTKPLLDIIRLRRIWTRSPQLNLFVLIMISIYPAIVLCCFWTSKVILLSGLYVALLRHILALMRAGANMNTTSASLQRRYA